MSESKRFPSDLKAARTLTLCEDSTPSDEPEPLDVQVLGLAAAGVNPADESLEVGHALGRGVEDVFKFARGEEIVDGVEAFVNGGDAAQRLAQPELEEALPCGPNQRGSGVWYRRPPKGVMHRLSRRSSVPSSPPWLRGVSPRLGAREADAPVLQDLDVREGLAIEDEALAVAHGVVDGKVARGAELGVNVDLAEVGEEATEGGHDLADVLELLDRRRQRCAVDGHRLAIPGTVGEQRGQVLERGGGLDGLEADPLAVGRQRRAEDADRRRREAVLDVDELGGASLVEEGVELGARGVVGKVGEPERSRRGVEDADADDRPVVVMGQMLLWPASRVVAGTGTCQRTTIEMQCFESSSVRFSVWVPWVMTLLSSRWTIALALPLLPFSAF